MRYLLFVFCFLVFFNWPKADAQQRELLYGTASAPVALDTVIYPYTGEVDSSRSITRQVTFKGPLHGFVSIYGKVRAISGTDTSFTVWYRNRGSVYDSPAIWSQYDSLGVIADGDSTFFFSIFTPSSFKISDGLEVKFVMDTTGNTGAKNIEIKAAAKMQ